MNSVQSPTAMAISLLSLTIFENSDVSAHIHCYVCGASKAKLKSNSFYDENPSQFYEEYPDEPGNFSDEPIYPDEFGTVKGNVKYQQTYPYARQSAYRNGGECEKFKRPEACLRGSSNCIALLFPEETKLKPLLSCGNREIKCNQIALKFVGPPTCQVCNTNLCNAGGFATSSAARLLPFLTVYLGTSSLILILVIKIDPS